MPELGVLHVVKAQCSASSFVTKVKLVERCFDGDATVRFEMYDAAPAAPPTQLPYFVDGADKVQTDENGVVRGLGEQGAAKLVSGDGVDTAAVDAVLASSADVSKAVKAATKSKTEQALATNKQALAAALRRWEERLQQQPRLAGEAASVADLVALADVRPAFEKVLDSSDREALPKLTAWYKACFESIPAVRQVWRDQLVLCTEASVGAGKKPQESKEEKKAREKARQKEKKAAQAAEKASKPAAGAADASTSGAGRNEAEALPPKEGDFSKWYSAIIVKSELLSYYEGISGCYILRPGAWSLWEAIQRWFDDAIKAQGVENCMFPLFITKESLEREQEHVEDFAPEVAWVTKSGDKDLENGPVAIRPTSETAMYPYFAKWITSHRDLPLKINQWTNVVRWEIKQRTPFVRTREFFWQEGHTAHSTSEEARKMVDMALEWYRRVYEELLAIPVIPGTKSQKEKFAGADDTLTVEAFIPETGKGIQGATSHALGQNFSKMFGIVFTDDEKRKEHAWQTSWGMTTRTLGVLVMTHGDNKGLVLPPRIARKHAVVVPITMAAQSEEDRGRMYAKAEELAEQLTAAGVNTHADLRENYTPGNKYSQWELKGVCVRLELGPKDMQKESVLAVRRDSGAKEAVPWADLPQRLPKVLQEMQAAMFERAKAKVDAAYTQVASFAEFKEALAQRKRILAPWCDCTDVEGKVKAATRIEKEEGAEEGGAGEAGAKTLCIPFEQPALPEGQMCIFAEELVGEARPAKNFALWGRSY